MAPMPSEYTLTNRGEVPGRSAATDQMRPATTISCVGWIKAIAPRSTYATMNPSAIPPTRTSAQDGGRQHEVGSCGEYERRRQHGGEEVARKGKESERAVGKHDIRAEVQMIPVGEVQGRLPRTLAVTDGAEVLNGPCQYEQNRRCGEDYDRPQLGRSDQARNESG